MLAEVYKTMEEREKGWFNGLVQLVANEHGWMIAEPQGVLFLARDRHDSSTAIVLYMQGELSWARELIDHLKQQGIDHYKWQRHIKGDERYRVATSEQLKRLLK